jgi:hypothetical protein
MWGCGGFLDETWMLWCIHLPWNKAHSNKVIHQAPCLRWYQSWNISTSGYHFLFPHWHTRIVQMKPEPGAVEGDLWLCDTLAVNHKLCDTMLFRTRRAPCNAMSDHPHTTQDLDQTKTSRSCSEVTPAQAKGIICGGDPPAGISMGCLSQCPCGLLSMASTPLSRTITKQVSFEQASYLVLCRI